MARICLPYTDDRDAVGAALGGQPEVDDLRKLLLQQRNEDLVQREPERGRLVGRPPRESGEVDRILPHRDRGNGKDRKLLDRVVIAGVIAVGALVTVIAERDFAFDDDLGFGRNLQGLREAIGQLDAGAAQESRELIFGKGLGHRRHRGDHRARIGADHGCSRKRFGMILRPAAMMLRAAAMPARIGRPLGHDQRPGDQRRRLAWPAGLDGKPVQIDIAALQHDLLARCTAGANGLGFHCHDASRERQQLDSFGDAARRLGLADGGEKLADLAQGFRVAPLDAAHGDAHRYALHRAEEIDQHRNVGARTVAADRVVENDGRTAFGKQPGLDFGHLEHG